MPPSADVVIERFWKTLEEQTESMLVKHADEVETIAQALMQTGDDGADGEPIVADVLRPGYTMKGRVVRHAGVRVERRP